MYTNELLLFIIQLKIDIANSDIYIIFTRTEQTIISSGDLCKLLQIMTHCYFAFSDHIYINKTMVFYFVPNFFYQKGYFTSIRPGLTNVESRYPG